MTKYNSKYKFDEKILASVVHFTQDSIIVTTKDLDTPGPEIVYVNPGFTRMTGYSPEEVLGKTPRILQGPKTDQSMIQRLRATLDAGNVFYGQAINYRKDGSEFWNEWHIEPIRDDAGELTHYIAIQHDISQRKKVELAIEQKNSALKEILEQIEIEKSKIKEGVSMNVEEVLIPALKKMKRKGTKLDKQYIDILERNLNDLTSSFGIKVSSDHLKLSPREVEIANLIKNGLASKEIVQMLSISFKTVETHRNRIRNKLGIINKDINLTTYLQTL
ncbi:MAG: PAS domain S-box-containing protein [Lysobacterales bacterium]|jgi:PAS domain S-box-containing protein